MKAGGLYADWQICPFAVSFALQSRHFNAWTFLREGTQMSIALSHGGPTVYSSNKRSDELLVGTAKGVTTLKRDATGWHDAGTVLPEQHISAILVEPTTGDVYAGAYKDGSLRVSHDG